MKESGKISGCHRSTLCSLSYSKPQVSSPKIAVVRCGIDMLEFRPFEFRDKQQNKKLDILLPILLRSGWTV